MRRTISFMTGRKVKLVLDEIEGESHEVQAGISQGSPAAPIHFISYLSGLFEEVEKRCKGFKALSFADDISWWVEGSTGEEIQYTPLNVDDIFEMRKRITSLPARNRCRLSSRGYPGNTR